jgi:hypothetical protein
LLSLGKTSIRKIRLFEKFAGKSMRRSLVLFGSVLFVAGLVLGFYASERNCLIAFVTKGYINFWTAIEILGGLAALVGIITAIIGLLRK